MKGGDNTIRVNISSFTATVVFKASRELLNDLRHKTVKYDKRRPTPVTNLVQMTEGYMVQSTDAIKISKAGNPSLKLFALRDFMHTRTL